MKKILSLSLCLLLLFRIAEAQEDWMPDANLRAAIRETLGLPEDAKFTKVDMLKLEYLDFWRLGIRDLTSMEQAKNLEWFSFAVNDVSDLVALCKHCHDGYHGRHYEPLRFQGASDTLAFNAWLEHQLCPLLNEKHVMIMDNASFHKGSETA